MNLSLLSQVILSCVINKELLYNKVMPTFHHWHTGKQRNGLTFQTAADARAFDKGIRKAFDAVLDGKVSPDKSVPHTALFFLSKCRKVLY